MSRSEFSKELLRSSALDAPLTNAKARALAHVEHALGAIATTAAASSTAAVGTTFTAAKLGLAIGASALFAGAIGVGGGYELGRSASPERTAGLSVKTETTSVGEPAPLTGPLASSSPAAVYPGAPGAASAPTADVCEIAPVAPSGKCSTPGGHTVTFALKSNCSKAALDVFWVDESCHEIFRGMLSPSTVFWQDSWDTHVFHMRDHVTHLLVKEIVPAAVGGAPDRAKIWKGPPTELPLVTIHEGDPPTPDVPPSDCTHGGGRAARLHVKNERKDGPIALVWIDAECKEHNGFGAGPHLIGPGKTLDWHTSEGHAFRVRSASGAPLMDIRPTSLDTTTYLTVP